MWYGCCDMHATYLCMINSLIKSIYLKMAVIMTILFNLKK